MRKRSHKHILLFVIVLILPSILVTALGWTVLNQDRESRAAEARGRAEEARVSARLDIQRAVRQRLEDVRLQAVEAGLSVDPAVKFIAWMDGEKLVMPWERDPNAEVSRTALEERDFATRMEDADFLEIAGRLDQAVATYRSLIQSSISEHQRAYARRSLAAVLKNSGAKEEASGVYRDLLTLPSSLGLFCILERRGPGRPAALTGSEGIRSFVAFMLRAAVCPICRTEVFGDDVGFGKSNRSCQQWR